MEVKKKKNKKLHLCEFKTSLVYRASSKKEGKKELQFSKSIRQVSSYVSSKTQWIVPLNEHQKSTLRQWNSETSLTSNRGLKYSPAVQCLPSMYKPKGSNPKSNNNNYEQ